MRWGSGPHSTMWDWSRRARSATTGSGAPSIGCLRLIAPPYRPASCWRRSRVLTSRCKRSTTTPPASWSGVPTTVRIQRPFSSSGGTAKSAAPISSSWSTACVSRRWRGAGALQSVRREPDRRWDPFGDVEPAAHLAAASALHLRRRLQAVHREELANDRRRTWVLCHRGSQDPFRGGEFYRGRSRRRCSLGGDLAQAGGPG